MAAVRAVQRTALLSGGGLVTLLVGCTPLPPGAHAPSMDGRAAWEWQGRWHRVQRGETLEVLAQRYHTTPGAIAAANRLRPQDVPAPGESLYVLGPGRDRPEAELPWFRSTPVAEIDRTPTPSKESRQGGDGAARAKQSAPPRSFDGEPRFEWPVERGLGRITSSFGARGERPHRGIDIVVPEGFIVRAADDGEVIYSDNRLAGYGNTVMIRHSAQGAGLVTVYAHNRENLVKVGQRVQRGQSIARVGATGNAQVAHLHFEVREGAEAKDPQPYLERPRRAALTP